MNIEMTAGQAAALAKLIRNQMAAYDETSEQETQGRLFEVPFTGEDLDEIEELLPLFEGVHTGKIVFMPGVNAYPDAA